MLIDLNEMCTSSPVDDSELELGVLRYQLSDLM